MRLFAEQWDFFNNKWNKFDFTIIVCDVANPRADFELLTHEVLSE